MYLIYFLHSLLYVEIMLKFYLTEIIRLKFAHEANSNLNAIFLALLYFIFTSNYILFNVQVMKQIFKQTVNMLTTYLLHLQIPMYTFILEQIGKCGNLLTVATNENAGCLKKLNIRTHREYKNAPKIRKKHVYI